MDKAIKVLENRLRRVALRRGLKLERSRARDPHDLTFGGYHLTEIARNTIYFGKGNRGRNYACALKEIEWCLARSKPPTANQILKVELRGAVPVWAKRWRGAKLRAAMAGLIDEHGCSTQTGQALF